LVINTPVRLAQFFDVPPGRAPTGLVRVPGGGQRPRLRAGGPASWVKLTAAWGCGRGFASIVG